MTAEGVKADSEFSPELASGEQALVVDVEGFEGPLDLLLTLARQQKVDLAKISILALADQYLIFIEEARRLRLELAADYLVMAAWLAYLKSRMLLPDVNAPEGQSAEDMANALALRLKRLEAIRTVAEEMFTRQQLGRDIFARGQPEPIAHIKRPRVDGDALRPALGLFASAPEECALACQAGQACGVVAGGSARGARAADRSVDRLDPYRRVSDQVRGGAFNCRHGVCVKLCVGA